MSSKKEAQHRVWEEAAFYDTLGAHAIAGLHDSRDRPSVLGHPHHGRSPPPRLGRRGLSSSPLLRTPYRYAYHCISVSSFQVKSLLSTVGDVTFRRRLHGAHELIRCAESPCRNWNRIHLLAARLFEPVSQDMDLSTLVMSSYYSI
jgi:hypothetical protein